MLLIRSSACWRCWNEFKMFTAAVAAPFDAMSIFESCCWIGSEDVGPYKNVANNTLWSLMTSDWRETCDNATKDQPT